jgi:hypothetical protein
MEFDPHALAHPARFPFRVIENDYRFLEKVKGRFIEFKYYLILNRTGRE